MHASNWKKKQLAVLKRIKTILSLLYIGDKFHGCYMINIKNFKM